MSFTPEQWQRIRAVFDAAVELPEAERADYLSRECSDDPDLRREVESLLAAHQEDDSRVGEVVENAAGRLTQPLRVGTRLGPYTVLEQIGEGGMGAVYLAERSDETFTRRVAIKVVRGGLDSARVVERFKVERRILAGLDHPYIAGVLDGGTTPEGLPFLVMEYVDGEPIDRFCREQRVPLRERIALVRKMCEAVDHAHRQLVVHRDLKPGNVLVTAEGEPRLLDFGIAKLIEDPEAADSPAGLADPGGALTATRFRAMTPEYASPEQIRGEPVTTATDVHALGILLYELLTGRHPFADRTRTPRELEEAVLESDPDPPSTAVTRVREPGETATSRVDDSRRGSRGNALVSSLPAAESRELRGDLDNIVLKALAKEPARRYPSAAELSADLERYLLGHPVHARPATFSYRTGKFLRRNAVGVSVAAAFLITVITAGVVSTRAYLRADRMRIEAETQRDRLEEINGFLARIFQAASPEQRQSPEEITARDLLDAGAASVDEELGDRPEIAGAVRTEIGRRYFDIGSLDRSAEVLRAAVEDFRRADGLASVEGVTALIYLGQTHFERGAIDSSLAAYDEAMDLLEDLGEAGRQAGYEARKGITMVYVDQGELDRASPILESLLAEMESDPGRESAEARANRSSVANDLGLLRVRQGEYGEAVRLIHRALNLRVASSGETHSETGEIWSNLSYAQVRAGRYGDAVESARKALAIHERVLGPDHLQTANSRINLADALGQAGRVEEAEELYPQVLEVYAAVYGEGHPRIATVLNNAAMAMMNGGAPERAAPRFQEAAAIYATNFGEDHAWTAIPRHNRARALRQAGDLAEAERVCRQTLAQRQRIHTEDHPDLARSRTLLAAILRERDALEEAGSHAEEAVRVARATLAQDHPVRVGAVREWVRCLAGQGRREEAETILLGLYAVCDSLRGPEDDLTRAVAEQIGKLGSNPLGS